MAGLGRTAFYRYFPDLESVVLPAHGHARGEIRAAASNGCSADDPDAQLRERGPALRRASTGTTDA